MRKFRAYVAASKKITEVRRRWSSLYIAVCARRHSDGQLMVADTPETCIVADDVVVVDHAGARSVIHPSFQLSEMVLRITSIDFIRGLWI